MSLRGWYFVLAILACVAAAQARSGAPSGPFDAYDVLHYDLSLRIDPSGTPFGGSVGITCVWRESSTSMLLHAAWRSLRIDTVFVGKEPLISLHMGDTLLFKLPRAARAGDTTRVRVVYHGTSHFAGNYDGGGMYFSCDSAGNPHIATISQPFFSREWWPCKDLPNDKATASITVTVPRPLVAVSNGVLSDVAEGPGERTYRWETRYPIASYLVSIAVADYAEFADTYTALDGTTMPVRYYVYRQDSAKARFDFRNTTALLGWFAKTFCEYPFVAEKFGYAEVDGSLTMENQTIVSVERNLITGTGEHETTLIHEMSHHWWGNLITPASWYHTWLSEGLATLAEGLYIEHAKGPAAYRDYMDILMQQPLGSYRGAVAGVSDTAFWDSFGPQVYFKGAIVLHMLRRTIGDSAFFGAIRSYLSDPALRYGNATTEDFQRACEKASTTRLDWFFRQWVYTVCDSIDRPALRLRWTSERTEHGALVRATIAQTHEGSILYRLPLAITVEWAGGSKSVPVVVSGRSDSFEFAVPGTPTSVLLDKDHDIFFTREQ